MTQHLAYDEPELSHHRVVAKLATRELPSGGTMLDVGCGLGQILGSVAAARPDAQLIGIDGDRRCVQTASQRLPDSRVELGDVGTLQALGHRSIDVVVMSHSLEHFRDPPAVLEAARALLRPDGKLVLAVPNALQLTVIGRELSGRGASNPGHYYIWNWATFDNCLRLCGVRVLERHHDDVPLVTQRARYRNPRLVATLERAVARVLPALSYSLIVVGEPM